MKRQDYISWDEYFMGIALLSAMRSKDNNSQVGACIVSPENKILSLGYNGMPIGCNDDDMPWEREGSDLDTKYMYVCHSELNAILNSPNHDLRGSRMYVTLFPCNECAKAIIQSGIKELIYLSDKYHDTHASIASRRMFNMTGVKYRAYQPTWVEWVCTMPPNCGKARYSSRCVLVSLLGFKPPSTLLPLRSITTSIAGVNSSYSTPDGLMTNNPFSRSMPETLPQV